MLKYTFMVYHADYEKFLLELKRLGVLHVIEHDLEATAEMQEAFRQVKEIDKVVKMLAARKKDVDPSPVADSGAGLIESIKQYQSNLEQLQQQLVALKKELKHFIPWGNFSWESIDKLAQSGVLIRFLMVPASKYLLQWEETHQVELIGEGDGYKYFVQIARKGEPFVDIEADEVKLPRKNYSLIETAIAETQSEIERVNQILDGYQVTGTEVLNNYKNELLNTYSLQHAKLHTREEVEGKLKLVEGWVPAESEEALNTFLEHSEVLHLKSMPAKTSDKPPVKLRNGKFSKLFEPIGNLYSLPDYGELDMTPFFAPFFMLFFGFCLGDAGYGIVMLLATTLLKKKVSESIRPILTLGQWFGASTILMGLVGGTVFGESITGWKFGWVDSIRHLVLDQEKLMYTAIGLGAVQILFGMFLKVVNISRIQGFRSALSQVGWLIVIIGMGSSYALGRFEIIGAEHVSIGYYLSMGIGGILVFFFNSPGKSPFINFGLGIWDSYGMVSGLLGDLLSYIRLFALGLSSAVLGHVFNQLAFSLTGDIPVLSQFFTVLILLVGHSINFFMALLGAFVHPLRLTFVEFYKHSGFNGGGKIYNPLKNY
jgi:V/A-type H+-transporting ATPase subunit I